MSLFLCDIKEYSPIEGDNEGKEIFWSDSGKTLNRVGNGHRSVLLKAKNNGSRIRLGKLKLGHLELNVKFKMK